ncbi:MAG: AAA family ATPase [Actinomycetota bacterium]|jgi:DNA repair protein RecN (Recombination protein N)|nr:AAA family ATPase [Actinomycetota bacterium]
MLVELHIENLAVIESATVLFEPGLTAITGESGSGKSMLVQALSLALGSRSDPSMVRSGASEARVDARFIIPDPDGAAERVITRSIPAQGRSRAYIDGRPTTATAIAESFGTLIEVHAQHEYHRLGDRSTRCALLDMFGSIDTRPLNDARARIAEIEAELATLGGDRRSREREIDLLRYQLTEIDAAELDPDEPDRLDDEERLLTDVDAILTGTRRAIDALDHDRHLLDALRGLEASPILEAHHRRLDGLVAELRDLRSDLVAMEGGIDHDPARLEAIADRKALIGNLLRRYGRDIVEVLTYRDGIKTDLERLQNHDQRADQLVQMGERAREHLSRVAAEVARRRAEAAPALAGAITERLQQLDMSSARFDVVTSGDDGGEVEYLLDGGDGRALPVSRVASGGELARCMLAIDLVLEPYGGAHCVVLDEIDAGMGGATGGALAAVLGELALRRQVIVVTHLPTIAAAARSQVAITRHNAEGAGAFSTAQVLDHDSRLTEIARMFAGSDDVEALDLARRLLDR